ncbi:hypothetical protein ACFWA1_35940 [Streptomyces sp. NPDC060005]|uniref:hypothetical protein n=1 Tax=Streptomyces sp. NPDC060005 TaxID=3347034 RepID=UPI0036CDDBF8
MTPRTRLILAIVGLVLFVGLAITMLCLGQPVSAITSLIPVIALAVPQLLQALDGRSLPTARPRTPLRPVEDVQDVQGDEGDEGDEGVQDDERPAA